MWCSEPRVQKGNTCIVGRGGYVVGLHIYSGNTTIAGRAGGAVGLGVDASYRGGSPVGIGHRSGSITQPDVIEDCMSPQPGDSSEEESNSYINVLKFSNGVWCLESHSPDIVLDDECVISKELSYSLMGRVKEFALLTNLKTALLNEGFANLSVRYLGELWVLLEFSSSKTKKAFRVNVGVSSWFSEIKQASLDIIPDGRIMWVEIIFKGKVFWIRAKEVPGWVPDLIEESEKEEQSDVGSLEGDNKMNEDDLCGDNMDMAEVLETVFDESNGQKKDVSQDPFGDDVDSVSVGRFKKSEAPRSGGSFLCLMEEVVKVGQTIGYNMEGVVNNLSDIIESHGESLVNQ
nr:nucleotide-binding alpha-beta plait domain-containing protein [Tanacetum cinerariifolium]